MEEETNIGWEECELPNEILKALKELGFDKPTPIQSKAIIPSIRQRRDILGAAETGSGKTLAFGIPLVANILQDSPSDDLKALIFAPTRELALQITNHIKAITKYTSIKVGVIVGGLSLQKQERILSKNPDIIVATPGRMGELVEIEAIKSESLANLRYLVIDEADRMIEKGHFESLNTIIRIIKGKYSEEETRKRQNFVYSATLTFVHKAPLRTQFKKQKRFKQKDETYKINSMVRLVGMQKPLVIDLTSKQNKPATLTETKIKCPPRDKDTYLYFFLSEHPGRTLIFCNAINTVNRLKKVFDFLGISMLKLHANMEMKQRLKSLEKFSKNEKAIMIATDVAARGLDIELIQHIVHYHIPKTAEIYVHRSGRTARASKPGHSLMLIEPQEYPLYIKIWKNLKRNDDLPQLPIVNQNIMNACRERVNQAILIEKLEHQITSKESDRRFKKQLEEDFGSDSEKSEDEEDKNLRQAQQRRQIKALKWELNQMLQVPLTAFKYQGDIPAIPVFKSKKKKNRRR